MNSFVVDSAQRPSSSFHRKFPCVRPAIEQILEVAKQYKNLKKKSFAQILRNETNLGTIYVEAMPRYAHGIGFFSLQNKELTRLGELVYEHDPHLNLPVTLWLMHYHLSAPTGPGPTLWHYLVSQKLHPRATYDETEVEKTNHDAIDYLREQEGVEVNYDTVDSFFTAFRSSYLRSDALGNLGLLSSDEDKKNSKAFSVNEIDTPPIAAIGYALAHYWQNVLPDPDAKFVNLSDLEAFARLLFLNSFQLNRSLRTLQRWGLLEVHQVAPPHQVVRNWETPDVFLERLYE